MFWQHAAFITGIAQEAMGTATCYAPIAHDHTLRLKAVYHTFQAKA